ncbi:EscU/YscU/HrcU family type III secretion system export apparatus switch protein [Microbulbifer rhizosphaerae]|uniref:Flagellar biosynthetic protein FlhB n=1 Tax=Microbulbifer rhizosphaerae TaxID=1562603 RepID=A0A7W4WFX8_9GAMM|nr:EscU/YscU/HrcU family type III secretion system export apparatus switch protein [Microbulbifer rhizosphaerae]MBB3063481.1 flagellar biosynthetic protein FlhB [Microbulbifer rhizosphaerae]
MSQDKNSPSEKTEPASPFKLREAKKMGQVAKSVEVVSVVTLIGFLIILVGIGDTLIYKVLDSSGSMISSAGHLRLSKENLGAWAGNQLGSSISVLVPVLLMAVTFGVIGNIIQTGFIFSLRPLKPDFNRLNPVNGFKKIFSLKALFDLFKSFIKLAALGGFLYLLIISLVNRWVGLTNLNATSATSVFLESLTLVLALLIPVIAVIALLDLMFSQKSFLKQMRMTKQEVKDEIKRREGDPKIKQRRKELQQELRKRTNGLGSVPSADLIITNPTHIAVAIRYDRRTMAAPIVVAKGTDQIALTIREIARNHGIQIVHRSGLARYLYKSTKVQSYIPVDTYMPVARLLRDATQRQNSNRSGIKASSEQS